MSFYKRFSIGNRLILMMISSSLLTLVLMVMTILYFNIQTIKERGIQNISILGDVIAERSTAALTFMDNQQAEKNLKSLNRMKYIEFACLYNESYEVVARYQNKSHQTKIVCPDKVENTLSKGLYQNKWLIWGSSIEFDKSVIGFIYIVTDDAFVFSEFYDGIYQYALILFFVFIFNLFVANYIQKFISVPIVNLESTTRQIKNNKDFSIRAQKTSNDELGDLIDTFNDLLEQTEQYEKALIIQKEQLESHQQHLEETVKQRTSNLQVLNNELISTLHEMKNIQGQLIESEKMASLGGLVAGIAHEINTPIGICLTASSFLKERNDILQKAYQEEEMTQEDFEGFLQTSNESIEIILKNIQRATEIIKNFKKVSVDQSVEEKRCFNVKNYFAEIIKSLHPKLKRYNHTIEVLASENIYINSYPGSFYQIFSNLILNSLVHGFETIDQGKIVITVKCKKNEMKIEYQDNGQGMPAKIVSKVFEPFVTTKRNKGGTGLGAHIIYNIVTQQLNGYIGCHSVLGEGVKFDIVLPIEFCKEEG